MNKQTLKELNRKAVHVFVGAVIIAVSYWLHAFGFKTMNLFLLAISAGSIVADILMAKWRFSFPVYKQLQRSHEKHGIHHHTFALISVLILLQVFETRIVAVSALMLVFGDAAAAIVGKFFGKHKISGSKTIEGSLAMLCVSVFAGSLLGWTGLLMAVAATIAEAYSAKISDGITIPFVASLVGYITTLIV